MARYRMKPDQVDEVLKLREQGYSFSAIARQFGKDHTTIMYHCEKAGLLSIENPIKRERIARTSLPKLQQKSMPESENIVDGEILNQGKSYAEYVEEENKRKWKKRKDIALNGL